MKAIIFDFGGVIALQKELYYIPIYPDAEEWHKAESGEIPEEDFWKKLEDYYHKNTDELLKMLFEERKVNSELIEFLKTKKGQLRFGFINNGLSKLVNKMVDEWKLGESFDVMLCSSNEKLSKPDPKIFLLACEKLELTPQDCIFVGRKESYVEIAQSLGMKGFVYKDFEDFKTQLSGLI